MWKASSREGELNWLGESPENPKMGIMILQAYVGPGKGNQKIIRTFEECVFQSSCGLMASLFPERLLLALLAFVRPRLHMAAVCCSSGSFFL